MSRYANHAIGEEGELDVVRLIPCPNCDSKLEVLPPGTPLYDVRCSACPLRAQVKTSLGKPKATIMGAGWKVMDDAWKSGVMPPYLISNNIWEDEYGKQQEIRFYPFVSREHLKKRRLSETAQRKNYWMFDYVRMDEAPFRCCIGNNKV